MIRKIMKYISLKYRSIYVQHPEKWHNLHHDLQPSPEIKKIAKVEKFDADLHNKTKKFLHIRNKNKIWAMV